METLTTGLPSTLHLEGVGNGKLLLFGEHSAVYGEPAVGIPLPWKTALRLDLERSASGDIAYYGMESREQELFWSLINLMGDRLFPGWNPVLEKDWSGTVRYESTVPPWGGYGSSAAVCTALADALLPLHPGPAPEKAVLANEGETLFHGTPSGIDAVLSSSRGLTAVYPAEGGTGSGRFPRHRELAGQGVFIVTASVPRRATTKELVASLRQQKEKDPASVNSRIAALGSIASEAIQELSKHVRPEILGAFADKAHEELSALGLSAELTEDILLTGRQTGALGGKLSGAGGGGACFLVCGTLTDARRVHAALSNGIFSRPGMEGRLLPIIEIGGHCIHERN
ncbi:MAG: hypothetical protein JXB03_11400 [Spirochaetales bacterium]|nr:hypothetical protein [Spirochaetales bacterium]